MQMSTSAWKTYYTVTMFAGMLLLLAEISLYRDTIISYIIPIVIIVVVGFVAFMLNKEHYTQTYAVTGFFFPLMQNIISWGFIACYLFMASNYYLSFSQPKSYKFKIIEKNSTPGGKGDRNHRAPLVTFNYFGSEKELVFTYYETDRVNKADSVAVTTKKGLLGFDILTNYTLIP
jgi:hypothetical protein